MSDGRPGPIRVMVVDDHPLLREGVAAVLEPQPDLSLVGEASNGPEAIEGYRRWRPDVSLMDLQMPEMGGLEALGAIRAEFPQARIVVLTTYAGDAQAMRAMKAGAVGYLLKSSLRRELVSTIREVHRGHRYLHPEVASALALGAIDEPLTAREIAVLQLVAGGNSNKRIAHALSLSEETVKSHMKNIALKLSATDRTHAVVVAARRGIIEL
ncbi:response regulator [Sphingomonas nostoxanthinifaciens]|uniref:response regulator n=1 Tax=Sphingomonas nostoxanthinifaciens TaxID=2872652 RepID=UPI001CC21179|nr:response regulator transcription factor [Sphingomonas nostoxanthinifaciens]UAK26274.1 response regulator transcription factor [Sphingomonas nostoxanthinifaciens]